MSDEDSLNYLPPEPISLVDETAENNSAGRVWAKDVHIDEYEVIKGSTKIGAYVVWLVRIETVSSPAGVDHSNGEIKIAKRYSEFDTLRAKLLRQFPERMNEIPDLPPKSFVSRFHEPFLVHRGRGLQYFLLCILLNPVFASAKEVRDFIRS
ncbi:hypothetical protein TRVA0_036S00958 [Trichomonascus vanleenenianus]|uniref:Ypt35p n=1 Tax=Trichomonascus vanleenenianus TaxID=2268995 RepID=UPI003ECA7845